MSFINKELYENADSQRKATQITWEIADCLHQVGAPTYNAFPLIPYLLHNKDFFRTCEMCRLRLVACLWRESSEQNALWSLSLQ